MKQILLINGSPNKDGNTAAALRMMEDIFLERGLATTWFQIGKQPVRGCQGCGHCKEYHAEHSQRPLYRHDRRFWLS